MTEEHLIGGWGWFQGLGFSDLAISESFGDFEYFGVAGKGTPVGLFVGINGHDELELFVVHFALFGGASFVGASSAWASTSVPPFAAFDFFGIGAGIGQALPSVRSGTSIRNPILNRIVWFSH
jgi:hypothetical protein